MAWPELEITADLSDALGLVLGAVPSAADAVVVIAASLDRLAKGYGLSESGRLDWDPLERADLPGPAAALIHQLFADGAPQLTADHLRDRLGHLLLQLAEDRTARKTLNKNNPLTDLELLHLGQIYWNLEARGARARLPLQPGRIRDRSRTGAELVDADIRVPNADKDFATMLWTARGNEKGTYKSSGQGFRKQGARLAVLAAQLLVSTASRPLLDLEGATLHYAPADPSPSRVSSITWPEAEPTPAVQTTASHGHAAVAEALKPVLSDRVRAAQQADVDSQRVLVGAPAQVGADFQVRGIDTEIEQLWADGGDRRIWLRGGPGLGKSYSARRVIQRALSDQGPVREELLIWVDSADPESVTMAFAEAMDRLSHLGVLAGTPAMSPPIQKARRLLEILATSTWRWLIVLDNADARPLLDAGLLPSGANPNGRALFTTRSRDPRIASHGRAVRADLFTPEESEAYLRSEAHAADQGPAPLSLASREDISALAAAVGHHPLALSVAASTIVANAMTVRDWIEEFTAAEGMDAAADEPDRGGYPHLIGATWQVALARASQGLPDGVVERAAMVAAVQDPDGHPTWLWDRPAVADWVSGGSTLARHHGVPVAVQRLIDAGIVDLRGGTWRQGRVAIHQLAARAVRELPNAATLAELAAVLAQEWLLQLTADATAAQPALMRGNIRPMAVLSDLPLPTVQTVAALLEYEEPNAGYLEIQQRSLDALVAHLRQGGVVGRMVLARQVAEIGDDLAELGRDQEATTMYERAATEARELLEDPTLTDDLQARLLKGLGGLEKRLGQPDQARERFTQAAELLERNLATASDSSDFGSRLVDLVELHEELGNTDRKVVLLDRADELLQRAPAADASGTDRLQPGDSWWRLGDQLATLGRRTAAKESLARAARVFQQERSHSRNSVLRDLALLHCADGGWEDADEYLARIVSEPHFPTGLDDEAAAEPAHHEIDWANHEDLVLLASVKMHRRLVDDAAQLLARAAGPDPQLKPDPQSSERYPGPDHEGLLAEQEARWRAVQDEMAAIMVGNRLFAAAQLAQLYGRWGDVAGLSEQLLTLAQRDAAANPGDHETRLASEYRQVALAYFELDRYEVAVAHLERAVAIRQTLADLDPTDVEALGKLADDLGLLSLAYFKSDRPEEALAHAERLVVIRQALADVDLTNHESQDHLADGLRRLGMVYMKLDRYQDASAQYERAVAIRQALADLNSADPEAQDELADDLGVLYWACHTDGRHEEALAHAERLVAIRQTLADRNPANPEMQDRLAVAQVSLAVASQGVGRLDEAPIHLTAAVSILRGLADEAPGDHVVQARLGMALAALGQAYAEVDRLGQAADCLDRSGNILELLARLDPAQHGPLLIGVFELYSKVLRELGRAEDAERVSSQAEDWKRRYPDLDTDDDE